MLSRLAPRGPDPRIAWSVFSRHTLPLICMQVMIYGFDIYFCNDPAFLYATKIRRYRTYLSTQWLAEEPSRTLALDQKVLKDARVK